MRRRGFPLWTVLGVVLVVALVIGTGVLHSSPPSAAQRATAIDSVIRCPSCQDLSVAGSNAPTAVTVRATVRQLIDEGRTDRQVKDYLVARYGSAIVLEPPASGWSLVVWVVPLAGGAIALVLLGTYLFRRRNAADGDAAPTEDDADLGAGVREERRRFLEQSLADADAEYLAGDLSDRDYLALRRRDMARLAGIGATAVPPAPRATAAGAGRSAGAGAGTLVSDPAGTISAGDPDAGDPDAPDNDDAVAAAGRSAPRRRSRRSWWFLGGAAAAFGAALIVSVTLFASGRQPGQSATGSFAQSQQQQLEETLAQAATDENQGDLGQAATLYQSVLARHPDSEVALAQLGWLEVQTGQQGKSASLISDGRAKLNRAVQLAPGDYAVHLYLGTVLLEQDGNAAGAVGEYRRFLSDGPPAAVVQQAAPVLRKAYQAAGVPLPAQVPAA